MPSHKEDTPEPGDYTPDWVLPKHGAVREDNWPELEAKGFEPVAYDLTFAQNKYGPEHVHTGDPFDIEVMRPLHRGPKRGDLTIYVDAEGLAIGREKDREDRQWMRDHGFAQDSDGGPGKS